jgi:hypothetical protein
VELLGPPQLRDGTERTIAILVMPPQQAGPFKGAWFKDPDGNILNVGQGPTS